MAGSTEGATKGKAMTKDPMDQMEENVEKDVSKLFAPIRHWVFNLLERLERWRREHDICEVCHEDAVDTRCSEGCQKRICFNCESYFYSDATICIECRNKITPEDEAEMRKDGVLSLIDDCLCGMEGFLTCDLTEEEHKLITDYKKEQAAK